MYGNNPQLHLNMNTDGQGIDNELLKHAPREWEVLSKKDCWVMEHYISTLTGQLNQIDPDGCTLHIHMFSPPHLDLPNCKLLLVKNNPGENVTLVVSSTKGVSVRYYRIIYLLKMRGVQHDRIRGSTLAIDRTGYRQATIQELEPTVSRSN